MTPTMKAARHDSRRERTEEVFLAEIQRRRERREQHERIGNRSFWTSVGMMGTVGWSVALPLTAGALFGRWLDSRLDSNAVFMVFFMLVGLGSGCIVAWRTIAERR